MGREKEKGEITFILKLNIGAFILQNTHLENKYLRGKHSHSSNFECFSVKLLHHYHLLRKNKRNLKMRGEQLYYCENNILGSFQTCFWEFSITPDFIDELGSIVMVPLWCPFMSVSLSHLQISMSAIPCFTPIHTFRGKINVFLSPLRFSYWNLWVKLTPDELIKSLFVCTHEPTRETACWLNG